MPEHGTGRFFLKMEQIKLLPQLAMVALFRFFQHGQIGFQFLFFRPRRAVNALQHLVSGIAAPVSARHLHQPERLDFARRRDVRAATKVDEIPLAVKGNLLFGGNGGNQFRLVFFAQTEKKFHGVIALPDLAGHRNIAFGEFAHAFFDGGQIFRREGTCVSKIVIEAVFDDRPNRHLRVRVKFLDRISQQVRRRMPDDFQPLGILVGNDGKRRIRLDGKRRVHQHPIHLARQRSLGKPRAYARRNLGNGNRGRKGTNGTIGQRNIGHGESPGEKKVLYKQKKRQRRIFLLPHTKKACGRRDWIRTNDPHHVKVML